MNIKDLYVTKTGVRLYNTKAQNYQGFYYCKFCGNQLKPEYGYEDREQIGPYYECSCSDAVAEKELIDKCNTILLQAQLEIRQLEAVFSKYHQPNLDLVRNSIYKNEHFKLLTSLGIKNLE